MNCQEISALKILFIDQIQTDENLLKAIGNNNSDFKDHQTPDIGLLLSNNIFKYKYPRTLENETKVILSLSVSLRKDRNKSQTKNGNFDTYIYVHESLLDTIYGYTRMDYLVNKIDTVMNNSTVKNILGDLQFEEAVEMPPIKDWCVYRVCYTFSSFNHSNIISYVDYE